LSKGYNGRWVIVKLVAPTIDKNGATHVLPPLVP
jgi:hypothetical protein